MPDPLLELAGLSADELRRVLGLVAGTDIAELEVTFGALRFSVRRPATSAPTATSIDVTAPPEPSSLAITSPLVGIFRPSVSAGDALSAGQSIGAIEALGMPTSVDAPQGGVVEELLVLEGGSVEYGQPLLVMRRG
jgi:acetyl-CoA carboxylase biotin carboxyl carrier protein